MLLFNTLGKVPIKRTNQKVQRSLTETYKREVPFKNNSSTSPPNTEIYNYTTKKNICIIQPESKEIKIFQKIRKVPQPNSKRTILSEFAPLIPIKPQKKRITTATTSTYYNREKRPSRIFQKKMRGDKTLYNNNFSLDNNDNHEFLNINKNPDFYEDNYSKKRQIKPSLFQSYKNTSQIINLPGGLKREPFQIKDDINFYFDAQNNKKQPNFAEKVTKDYCSKVSCLPNSLTTKYKKNYNCNNIFLKKCNYDSNNDNINKSKNSQNLNLRYIDKDKNDIIKSKSKCCKSLLSNYYFNSSLTKNEEDNTNKGKRFNELKLKNSESYFSFDMMKPSALWNKKYQGIVKVF